MFHSPNASRLTFPAALAADLLSALEDTPIDPLVVRVSGACGMPSSLDPLFQATFAAFDLETLFSPSQLALPARPRR